MKHTGTELALTAAAEDSGQAMQLAQTLAKSGLIPRALQGKPGDVLVVLLTGKELGLAPMQSLRGIHVVEGKAVMSADLIVGLCARQRNVCEWFRLVESTDTQAVYETKRAGHPEPVRLAFTLEQAKTAGLVGKQNWRNYPAAMLRARCASALARAVYPDLMAGVYETDELGEQTQSTRSEPAAVVVSIAPPKERATEEAQTETVTAPPLPETHPPAPELDPLFVAIHEAQDFAALDPVIKQVQGLPKGDPRRTVLGAAINARRRELRAQ